MENTQDDEKVLNSVDLENELAALVSKVVIPSFVADKIKEKLGEKGVDITLSQLHELVDIIKKKMKTSQYTKYSPDLKEKEGESAYYDTARDEDDVVESVFKTIDELGDRIKRIEEARLKNIGEGTGRIVTTEDIFVPGQTGASQQGKVCPLDVIPNDPENVVVLMKWLQYLVDKVGKANLADVLDYYVDIGWISDKIINNLVEYSEGITEEKKEGETERKLSDLQARDHIESLLYIQRLKGNQPDSYFLSRIERKLNKMTKNLGNI